MNAIYAELREDMSLPDDGNFVEISKNKLIPNDNIFSPAVKLDKDFDLLSHKSN